MIWLSSTKGINPLFIGTPRTGKAFLARALAYVVLSDLMMPGMSGMEFYAELLRLYPETARRVVFLTGGAFTPEANAFPERVDNERTDKPFNSDALRKLVLKMATRG